MTQPASIGRTAAAFRGIPLFGMALGALAAAHALGAEPPRPSVPAPNTVLDAVWGGLSELHSGVGAAAYSCSVGLAATRESEYTIAFNHDSGHSRVDRRYPLTGQRVTRIDAPAETIFNVSGSQIVERELPLSGARTEGEAPFDVRILGLISFGELTISNDDVTGQVWQLFRAYLETFPAPTVRTTEDGLIAITWKMSRQVEDPQGDAARYNLCKRVTFVDPQERFVPKRTEIWDGFGPTPQIVGALYAVTETSWKVIGDVPVPTDCIYDIVGEPKHAELHLHWKSVNGPVDPQVFTIDGLDLPAGTIVVNDRLGPSVIESVIGAPSAPPAPAADRSGRGRWILTGVSLAALALVFAAIWIHKAMRSRTTS